MKIKFILIVVAAVSLPLAALSSAKAQSYREQAPISPVYIYQQMLSYAQAQEADKILKLLDSLGEILSAVNVNFGKNLKAEVSAAVGSGNSKKMLEAIYTLIYYDIKDVFRATGEGLNVERLPLEKLEARLKFAYLDYLLVSPEARKKDFNLDRDIRKSFTELLTGELARVVSQGNLGTAQNKLNAIEENYKSIFGL